MTMTKQPNEVTQAECLEAIEYLFRQNFIEDMTTDQGYYTKILLNKVANDYKILLQWD